MASAEDVLNFSIRPAEDDDLGPLTDTLAPDVPAAQIARRLEESRLGYREMLVAELEGQAVGTASIGGRGFERPGSLRLFALDVGTAFRRRGMGTALVQTVEAIAWGRGLDEVNLEVAVDNRDAVRLYERLGYRRHGEPVMDRWEKRLDDGSSQWVDVPSWVMAKSLDRDRARRPAR